MTTALLWVAAYLAVGFVVATLHALAGSPFSLSREPDEHGIVTVVWPICVVYTVIVLVALTLVGFCMGVGWLVKKVARR